MTVKRLSALILMGLFWPVLASGQVVEARRQMVAAAHPLAAEVGRNILRAGGSAVDAAIAAQLVLTLVEPQAAGIGGSTFMVVGRTPSDVAVFEGREAAPAGTRPDLFVDAAGKPLPYQSYAYGAKAVGVPGMLPAFEMAHREFGRLPWRDLFRAAIDLAERGFPVSPRLAWSIATYRARLAGMPVAAAYFLPDGQPLEPGRMLRNPTLAETFRAIATGGAAEFQNRSGFFNRADLAAYRAHRQTALCRPYRVYVVCGPPPPSSGAIAVLQMLALVERFDLAAWGPDDVRSSHVLAEAGRLAFADRNAYVGDGVAAGRVTALLDSAYLARRSSLISVDRSLGPASPGEPFERRGVLGGVTMETVGTSHVSVVDDSGLAVSMTSSVGDAFGSGLMDHGYILNNELADFDARTDGPNAPAPGKRPRSSMTPVLVFDRDGQLILALGSQGGQRIIGFVARMLVATLDWNLDIQAAIDLPHVLNRNGVTELEEGPGREALKAALERLGHQVRLGPIDSGQQGIRVVDGHLTGGGDRRREGLALGD